MGLVKGKIRKNLKFNINIVNMENYQMKQLAGQIWIGWVIEYKG